LKRALAVVLLVPIALVSGNVSGADVARKQFLWRVLNAPAPFYLVGSMHDLQEADYPTDLAQFNRAIDQSQKFIFERDPTNNDPMALWRRLNSYATYPRGITIQQKVSPSTFALLKRIARVPQSTYEREKPWAIAAFNLKAQGMEKVRPEWGMDHYIYSKVRYRAEFGGLETPDEFVRTFSDMSDRESESFLVQSIEYGQRSPELLDQTIAAWKAGDATGMYQLYAPRKNGADGYWRWIEKRTSLWVPRVEAAVKSGKPTMVVVGALHLCGPRGLLAQLRARGYKLEQM
jgi:uncharacterized protein YbaP (TraB family)